MDLQNKIDLIKRNTEEIVTESELHNVLTKKKKPIAYCGYEPNGPLHLGHLVTITKLQDLEKAGCKIKILLADLHALLNRKGEEEAIKKEVESWKKTIKALGIKAEIVIGSDFQFKKEYQMEVMRLAQHATINRGIRSMQEIARDMENATISQLWYPLMQVVDIKLLEVDIAVGGLEQRKVHMIGKDESTILKHQFTAIHTPLITSLKGPGKKMSKSIPGSAIALNDTHEEIKKSISEAYCPQQEIKDNPVLQIAKLIIFPRVESMHIKRPQKFGGDLTLSSYKELEEQYKTSLHPSDLKNAVIDQLEKIIAPIRNKL